MKNIVFIVAISLVLSGCSLIRPVPKIELNNPSPDGTNTNSPAVTGQDSLDLSGQGLIKIEQSVFEQTNLRQLDVSDNQLTGSLPAEIRQLQNLQILRATNNQMTGVPAEIGQLSNLVELDLSNNQLTGLPYELGNLKNLKILNLSGNNVSKYDLDIIRQSLPKDINIIIDSQPEAAVIYCQPEQRQADVCPTIYAPVCATVNIQCIKAPCDPIKETFSNSCVACQNKLVSFYTQGECISTEAKAYVEEGTVYYINEEGEKKVIATSIKEVGEDGEILKIINYKEAKLSPNKKFILLGWVGWEWVVEEVYDISTDTTHRTNESGSNFGEWLDDGRIRIEGECGMGISCGIFESKNSVEPWILERVGDYQ